MSFAKFREAAKVGGISGADDPAGGFDSIKPSADRPRTVEEAILGVGSKIVGKLSFEGPVQLNGEVEGEIYASSGLTVGPNAVVNAKVTGSDICIRGTLNGDICASGRLMLEKPARVSGNITAPILVIEEGVFFEGNCKMGGSLSSS